MLAVGGCVCDVDVLTAYKLRSAGSRSKNPQRAMASRPPPPTTVVYFSKQRQRSEGPLDAAVHKVYCTWRKNLVKTHWLFERKNEGLFGFQRSLKQFDLNSFVSCLV